jgi:hypothetical protein
VRRCRSDPSRETPEANGCNAPERRAQQYPAIEDISIGYVSRAKRPNENDLSVPTRTEPCRDRLAPRSRSGSRYGVQAACARDRPQLAGDRYRSTFGQRMRGWLRSRPSPIVGALTSVPRGTAWFSRVAPRECEKRCCLERIRSVQHDHQKCVASRTRDRSRAPRRAHCASDT